MVIFLIVSFFEINRGDLGIRRFRLKHHFKSELMFGCENPITIVEQPFKYIAVLDFEAICEENPGKHYRIEIIEFPFVLIDVKQQAIANAFLNYVHGMALFVFF
jgi:hypothetical protein